MNCVYCAGKIRGFVLMMPCGAECCADSNCAAAHENECLACRAYLAGPLKRAILDDLVRDQVKEIRRGK